MSDPNNRWNTKKNGAHALWRIGPVLYVRLIAQILFSNRLALGWFQEEQQQEAEEGGA